MVELDDPTKQGPSEPILAELMGGWAHGLVKLRAGQAYGLAELKAGQAHGLVELKACGARLADLISNSTTLNVSPHNLWECSPEFPYPLTHEVVTVNY